MAAVVGSCQAMSGWSSSLLALQVVASRCGGSSGGGGLVVCYVPASLAARAAVKTGIAAIGRSADCTCCCCCCCCRHGCLVENHLFRVSHIVEPLVG